jgi:hypothetical protein
MGSYLLYSCVLVCVSVDNKEEGPPSASASASSSSGIMGCFSTSRTQTDPEDDRLQREQNKKIDQQLQRDKQLYRATHRLLLLGL